MNRLTAGGQQAATQAASEMLDINPNNDFDWSTNAYQTIDGNVYTIDLKKIVEGDGDLEGYGFARLHCIKKQGWGPDLFATGMYLYKEPQPKVALTLDIDNLSNVVVKLGGEVLENVETMEVEAGTELSIMPVEDYELKSVTVNGVALENVANGITTTIPDNSTHTAKVVVTTGEIPLIAPKKALSNKISNAKMFASFPYTEDSFAALQAAITAGETALNADNATEESLTNAADAIDDAINALVLAEGYSYLTADMFKSYASVVEPGEGESAGCAYAIFEKSGTLYGDVNVSPLYWADLTDYDKIMVTAEGNLRFLMNRMVDGGNQGGTQAESVMLDIQNNNSWSAQAYLTYADNVYTVDLNKIVEGDADVEGYGYARLNAIKCPWGQEATVAGMYLYKEPKTAMVSFTLDIDDASHVVITLGGETLEVVEKGLVSKEVEPETELSIMPVEGYKLKSVTLNGVEMENVKDGITTVVKGDENNEANFVVKTNSTTGIIAIDAEDNVRADVYNVFGVKVMSSATEQELRNLDKGIYIHNGKKIIIK